MKPIFALAILLACSGCAYRDVTYYYYPNVHGTERFAQYAQRECAKFGLNAVLNFSSGRVGDGQAYVAYRCVERP
ncbi:hypothetical protein [Rhodoblastus sp.]|uniref:hypothetical protein n=1 Tax=Rhodoblastus sp. TaxID=1962975 RepID=UPI003F9A2E75